MGWDGAAPRTAPPREELADALAALDLSAPGAGLDAAALDELLEALQVALHAAAVHPQDAAERLHQAGGLVLHLNSDPRLGLAQVVERDDAGVAVALDRLPGDPLVGALLHDLGRPGVLLAARLGHPVEMRV